MLSRVTEEKCYPEWDQVRLEFAEEKISEFNNISIEKIQKETEKKKKKDKRMEKTHKPTNLGESVSCETSLKG